MGKFMTTGVMSSLRDDWATPKALFNLLDSIFHFTLDPCSTEGNHLCEKHYTKEDDGLSHSWKGEVVFMNPPYGKNMGAWISKALAESVGGGVSLSDWCQRGRTPDGGRTASRIMPMSCSSGDGSSMGTEARVRPSHRQSCFGGERMP